ncbi:MAG: hypothetical protein LC792_29830, partial [Actinobacteria bacterium]|nr:hypothetical protein [Actinomycetota bacterium]
LDAAVPLTPPGDYEVDDVLPVSADRWWFSAGTGVFAWEKGDVRPVADVGGPAGALATSGPGGVVVAVEGRGLVGVDESGAARDVCADEAVRHCVTDVAARPDGGLVVSVGSTEVGGDGWARELTKGRATGLLVVVEGGRASVAADGLAWPAGVAVEDDGSLLVSVGQAHRIERRAAGALNRGSPVLDKLAFYPGRIRRGAAGWWVAVPYLRNRATELVLSEPAMAEDMINSVDEEQWLVPSLRRENIYLDPLQMGQLRVLGVLKPWAPPRSYGLVFLFDSDGRVVESHHSRADGKRHGMTGLGEAGGRVVVAGKGCRSLLELQRD